MEGTKMNITYDYYLISHASEDIYPAWIKSERYDYCENFTRFLSFFKRK